MTIVIGSHFVPLARIKLTKNMMSKEEVIEIINYYRKHNVS